MRRPITFLESLSTYGDLVEIRIGTQRAYVPCHPELLRQVLTDDRTFDKGGVIIERFRSVLGNGLGTCPHSDHRRQRRLMQPAFSKARLEEYSAVMRQEITALSGSWQEGQEIDAFAVLYGLGLRVVVRTLLSSDLDDPTVEQVRHSFERTLHEFLPRTIIPQQIQQLPLAVNRRYHQELQALDEVVNRIIADCRDAGLERGGLLATLTASHAGGGVPMDDSEIHDQVITMLLGGSESTGTTLTWALYLLSQHPEIEMRLHEEVDTVLNGRPADWNDLPNLSLTHNIITETLRLYPPGWLLSRTTTKEVELAGTRMAPDTTIVFSPHVIQRQGDIHGCPDVFDPDRWSPDRTADLPRGNFVSFGGGPRKCIGDTFGEVQSTLALSTIAARWKMECAPGSDIRPVAFDFAYRPRRLILRPRLR